MDQTTLTRVVAEHDNVRLALAWFDEQGETEALLRLGSMLYGLWLGHGLYREGVQWVEQSTTTGRAGAIGGADPSAHRGGHLGHVPG